METPRPNQMASNGQFWPVASSSPPCPPAAARVFQVPVSAGLPQPHVLKGALFLLFLAPGTLETKPT